MRSTGSPSAAAPRRTARSSRADVRHARSGKKLGRDSAHRKALYSNLAGALIEHGRIKTTVTKAKAVKPLAEQMITLGRRGDLHARRQATAFLRSRDVVHKLFAEVAPLFKDRPGGYTRIVKIGPRPGDAAEMAYIELVNEEYVAKERAARTPEPAAVVVEEEAVEEEAPVEDEVEETEAGGRAPRSPRRRPKSRRRRTKSPPTKSRPSRRSRSARRRRRSRRRRTTRRRGFGRSSCRRTSSAAPRASRARTRRRRPPRRSPCGSSGIRNGSVCRMPPRNVPTPVIEPRTTGLPRPVSSPVSDSPSENAIEMAAPIAAARPATNASCGWCV